GVAFACVELVSWQNHRHYGTWTAVEFRQDAFERAYGALLRIDPAQRVPFVPVTRAALRRAAAVSPAAAEIAAVLASGAKDGYARYGCEYHRLDPCDNEFRGGWFMFALRDAVALAGHYASGAEAERFYAKLAEEIDAACAAQRLACGPPRRGLAPPLAPSEVRAIAANALRAAADVARFAGFELSPEPSTVSAPDFARDAAFLHSRAFARGESAPDEFADSGDRLRAAVLRAVADEYRWTTAPLALAAAVALAWALRRGLRALAVSWVAVAALLAVAGPSRAPLLCAAPATSV